MVGCRQLLLVFRFSFEGLQIADEYAAAIDLDYPFGLQTAQVAGYEFAHGPDLRREFLIAGRQRNLDVTIFALPFLVR